MHPPAGQGQQTTAHTQAEGTSDGAPPAARPNAACRPGGSRPASFWDCRLDWSLRSSGLSVPLEEPVAVGALDKLLLPLNGHLISNPI